MSLSCRVSFASLVSLVTPVACALGVLVTPAPAQFTQSGPGLPKLVYDTDELLEVLVTLRQPGGGSTNAGHAIMHDGYLAIVRYSPGGADFYDFENPYDPVLVNSMTAGLIDLSEPHTFSQTTAYGGKHLILARGPGGLGGTGFAILNWSDILAPTTVKRYDIPGVPGGYASGVFWLFYQAPYVFCGAGSLGLYVIDASDPANPFVAKRMPTSETGGFNAVNTLAIGNLLILSNSDGGPGYARFDISDPTDPVLLYADTNTSTPYGLNLNGGLLLVPAVTGPVASTNGGFFELRDPFQSSFPVLDEMPFSARSGSAMLQDGFVHVAASNTYEKIDIRDPQNILSAGSTTRNNSGGDWDWVTPMGNLVTAGDDQGFGTSIIPHSLLPDNTGPSVTMVVPEDGAVNQAVTTRVGITVSDMVALSSIGASSFFVRPVGGAPLAGDYSNQFGILNFSPDQPLQPDTTYEVVVPAGGLEDWSGNAVPTRFESRFSTGPLLNPIGVTAQAPTPTPLGTPVSFDVAAVSGSGPFQYSWDFGDGTPPTGFAQTSQASHAYGAAGHYSVIVTMTNGVLTTSDAFLQTVHHPLTPVRPTRSSTIALDESRDRVYCVNADNDTLSAVDRTTLTKEWEVGAGVHPRTVAVASDGTIWVTSEEDATVRVLDPVAGALIATVPLPYASAPFGVALSPDGSAVYVTLGATGEVAKLDPVTRTLLGTAAIGPDPRGIAIAADSERIFVTRFRSSSKPARSAGAGGVLAGAPEPGPGNATAGRGPKPKPVAEIYELSASSFTRVGRLTLAMDPGPDTDGSGRGLPNYLNSIAVSPDGRHLFVPSKKDNIERGLFRDGEALTFENTVRTILSRVDLSSNREDLAARVDFNDRDMAFAVEPSPLGDYTFQVLQGSNAVDVRDAYTGALVAGVEGTGLAPQGLALSSDGATLFVHNFMSRSLTAYDASGVTSSTSFGLPLLGEVALVANETLSAQVLRGKQIFYNAADPRMNEDGYLSCATCHLDGGQDGQSWDFTDRGEGLRNTTSLLGRSGTGHGRVHWTANFDEIQDFENDIRASFRGDGFLQDGVFANVSHPLGEPKAGRSDELDALAAYVSSLDSVGKSPYRNSDGSLTASASNGRALFQALDCQSCHSGSGFTDSPSGLLHDVGTIKASSGQASGGPLTALDTPTLRGLWRSAPYLHDGSAPDLLAVLTSANPLEQHGATGSLSPSELSELVDYLLQIDDLEPAP